jgi:hypothetical protein
MAGKEPRDPTSPVGRDVSKEGRSVVGGGFGAQQRRGLAAIDRAWPDRSCLSALVTLQRRVNHDAPIAHLRDCVQALLGAATVWGVLVVASCYAVGHIAQRAALTASLATLSQVLLWLGAG